MPFYSTIKHVFVHEIPFAACATARDYAAVHPEPTPELSEEIEIAAGLNLPRGAVLCVATNGELTDADLIAARVLAPQELAFFQAMNASVSRKTEWVLGRVAAKDAVRIHIGRDHGIHIRATDIVIAPDERSKPHVAELPDGAVPRGVSISIAHSKGVAAAVAWGGEHGPAGIDLEFPRKISDPVIAEAFTEEEIALAGGRENVIRLWCLKEAAAKATGDGIFRSLNEVSIVSMRSLRGADRNFACALLSHRGAHIAIARII